MKRITSLLMLSLFGLSLVGQNKIDYLEYTLDNGLHVILHQDNTTPVVAVSVLYHVGSKDEVEGRTGFAHFFEHLLFEGSENIERGEYMNLVSANGGNLNANTSSDRTFYYEVLPSNQLELGLWMEAERMLHAKIDEIGLETQREVVKEEKRLRIDNQPYGSWIENVFKYSFPGYHYEWVPIGSLEDLNAAGLEDFEDFYATYYTPNNATLSIAGDIDIKTTQEMIKKYFATIPRGKEVPRLTAEPKPLGAEVRKEVRDNIQLPGVMIAYRTPKENHPDSYALEMLSNVLSRGQSSRLTRRMVDEEEKAVQVFSFMYGLETAGLFINFSIANMGVAPEDLEKIMDEEVAKVQAELITEEEFQKIQNQIESAFVSSNSSMVSIAENLANYHVYYGDAGLINEEVNRYRKVTRQDIQRVAKKYLNKDNRVVLYYLPKEK
ncbi:MAG: insulinase family protein [Schleiferiaceae bacterium]|nr:insulinase family protein [Schleiferiaceae bacterium]